MNVLVRNVERAKAAARGAAPGERGAFLPYAVAWLLGVPLTILVIVYLIRGH